MKQIVYILICFSFLLVAEEVQIIQDEATLPILNPSLQDQKVRKIRLSNQLEAILVSDPHVQQSSVALTVMAGSWSDPDEHLGLAHFLEHMLFLGTKEFPVESDFTRFLASQGGDRNAFTHGDFTSYMFSTNTAGLAEGLKRFSSFFKDPLLSPSGVNRELNAINQEFAQGFNVESTREYFLIKALANPEHPFHRFQTGNSQTLANASTDILRQWYLDHYSANLMRLYVLSSVTLDDLQKMVVEDFSSIPNREIQPYRSSDPLLKDVQGQMIYMDAEKNTYTLSTFWEIPTEIATSIETRPDDLICYILGHEGKESLVGDLKKEGLAFGLCCGSINMSSRNNLLVVQVLLTAKGMENPDMVVERIFQTIARIKEKPFPEEIFNEYALFLKQRYQYQQREEPFAWATKQGEMMAFEPIASFPEKKNTLKYLDQEAITSTLNLLTPERVVVVLSAPAAKQQVNLKEKEKWMQISYAVEPIQKELINKWAHVSVNPNIQFPPPNPYLAQSLPNVKPAFKRSQYPNIGKPDRLINEKGIDFYYAPDPFYAIPRSFMRFQIQSPEIKEGSPQAIVLTDLYVKGLEHFFRDLNYEAQTADLDVTFERTIGGVQVTLEGFSESIEKFLPDFIARLDQYTLSNEDFEVVRESVQREYENFSKDRPAKQTFDFFKGALLDRYVTNPQKRNAIKKITYPLFQDFEDRLLKSTFVKGIVTGTITKEAALSLVKTLDKTLHPTDASRGFPYLPGVRSLSKEGPYVINQSTDAQGAAALLVLEVDGFSPQLRNKQMILTSTIGEAFFDTLRTKQQTGYIVVGNELEFHHHLFNYFLVQSTTHNPQELLWRYEQFIEQFLHNLKTHEISKERFVVLKETSEVLLREPPPTLKLFGELLFKLAFEIQDFDWIKKRLAVLPDLTYEEFTDFCKEYLGRQNKSRLAVLLTGSELLSETLEYTPYKKGVSRYKEAKRLSLN